MMREFIGNGMSHSTDNDIVISGISGRLPESSNIEEFKENLMKGIDMVTGDNRRWPKNLYGLPDRFGKIKDLDFFDASFFGVHPKQAERMDPQMRILLEVTYEAIVDAGINPFTIRGSRTGVFIGVSITESMPFWTRDLETITDGYALTGCCRAMFANRISFSFDFIGPSYCTDTACSSSLVSLHQAVMSMRAGECDAAIVGGMNLAMKPEHALMFHKLNMTSQDGKSKAFDAMGDGYARAEAVVTIYLQKAKDARRIYATVLHTKTNTDGYKPNGITYPNSEIQNQLMRETHSELGINPEEVDYVESHATGTKVGDPEEVNSIDRLFCKNRTTPLLIGTVKSNMGHSEACSGLCGIAKVIIAMETGVIPPNLHFKNPNPNIPALSEGRIRVVVEPTPWNGGIVAINSFGFGGTNAHAVVQSNPKAKLPATLDTTEHFSLPKLVAVSGRTEEAVHTLLDKALEHREDEEFLSLLRVVHKNDIPGHKMRGYEILGHNGTREMAEITSDSSGLKRPIWYVFSGMGSQWPGMARALLSIETFQCSMRRSADVLKTHGIDLMDIIMNGTEETYCTIMNSFVSIAAVQVALVDVLKSIGIYPDGIVGHSVGELGCAYADDTFTPEQTVLAAYYRGKSVVDSELQPGAMAAIGLSWEEAEKMRPSDVLLACHNSADSVTVSGPTESLLAFVQELKKRNIFAKLVNSSGYAFHSKYIASAGPKLRATLNEIIPNPKRRSSKWISSSIPEANWDIPLAQFSSSEYHVNNLLSPVLFQEAIVHIPANAITIEIAPHGLLQAILRRSLPSTVTNFSLHKRDHPNNLNFLLSNVGKLYIAGAQSDIAKLYPTISFPVGRGTPMIGPLIKWNHTSTWDTPNFQQTLSERSRQSVIQVDLSKEIDAYLSGHQIDGRVLFPATGYMVLAWKTFAKLRGTDFQQMPVVFENVRFERATIMPKEGTVNFSINILEGTGYFEICETGTVTVSGSIRASEGVAKNQLKLSTPLDEHEETLSLSKEDAYKELLLRGYEYRGLFQGITRMCCNNHMSVGELRWFNEWVAYMDAMFHFTILSETNRLLYLPSRLQYAAIDPVTHKRLVEGLSEDSGLPVYYYKNANFIKSGGVVIRGLKTSSAPRRQHTQDVAKYERYTFVPYENLHSLAKDPFRAKLHALTVLLQIVCENTMVLKVNVVEVAGNRTVDALLAPLALDVLYSEPLLTVNLQVVLSTSSDNYVTRLNQMMADVEIVIQDINCAYSSSDMHLAIAANILSNQSYTDLKNLAATLKSGGFILLEETAGQLDLKTIKALKDNDLMLVGKQTDPLGKEYVLLKKRIENRERIVIQITEKNISWLEDVKAALWRSENEGHEVLLVSQGEELIGLVGLMTCIRRETGGAKARYVFIQEKNAPKFSLSARFYTDQLEKGLMANVLKGERWGSYRHLRLDHQNDVPCVQVEHAHINTLVRGDLSSLRWIESPLNYYRPDDAILCSVYYAALNFRDIMMASGKISSDTILQEQVTHDCVLGIEFSGRDTSGRRVMGMVTAQGLATTVLADSALLWEVPDKWTLEEAATVPIVYLTIYYAFFMRGQLKPGESVLIHAGTGGVGQAAINVALHIGCTVFTTVGTPEKRQYLKNIFPQLTDKHIGNSRDTSFEDLILTETQGRGVDVVLNSLADEKLQASIRCLATNGRFLEIGKNDISNDSAIGMSMFLRNVSFHGIVLDRFIQNKEEIKTLARLVTEGIENGTVRPLPTTVFSKERVEQAFRLMAMGKHVGKILLKIRDEEPQKRIAPTPKIVDAIPRTCMKSEKSYVLVGGLGGFGLELANWMISRGAKIIVLVSRSGIRTGYHLLRVRCWREIGIKVIISTADVTTLSGAERLIDESNRLAPVGGIFNLAAVLHDALIENLEEAAFRTALLPKIDVTRNLDTVSRKCCPLLDHFVVFSSVSCGRGNVGQSNYGFANSAMERMMERRQANGLPGLAIQWGAVGDVGLIMDTLGDNDTEIGGTLPQRILSCLATMDIFLQQPYPVLSSMVLAKKHKSKDSGNKTSLMEVIANILGIKDINLVNPNDSLGDLGMDSLMSTEIKQTFERDYNMILSSQEIRNLTFAKLQNSSTNIETTKEQQTISNTEETIFAISSDILLMPSNELLPKEALVRLKTKSDSGPALFIVHAIRGLTDDLQYVASELERPLWGLQSTEQAPHDSISRLAEFYVNIIKKVQKKGPYHLAGYSFGAIVAFEMALQLESVGEKIILNLLDGSPDYMVRQIKTFTKSDATQGIIVNSRAKILAYFCTQFNRDLTFMQMYNIMKEAKSDAEMFDMMLEIIGDRSPYSSDDLKLAGYQVFKKCMVAVDYYPNKKFKGTVTLIKATDIYISVESDYGLSKICEQSVKIEEVLGDHRTILLGKSAKRIANILRV